MSSSTPAAMPPPSAATPTPTPKQVAAIAAAVATELPESEPDQPAVTSVGAIPQGDATSLAQVMMLLTQLIQGLPSNIAAAVQVDKPQGHLDKAKLDNRNFARIKTLNIVSGGNGVTSSAMQSQSATMYLALCW